MLSVGEVIDGRYVVESLLGQGGLAEVYRVRHRELNSVYALKMLTWRRKSLAERMLLEGRIQAQIRHPHVVAVTDVIRHDGRCGLLMEYVDGLTLEHYLLQRGALPLDEGLALFASILAAVTAAHDAGVLHRDLKPANVLLARTSGGLLPKVADFGIAKVVVEDMDAGPGFTAVGSLMGSPGYLAPEQTSDSASVDQRADIYALGVILYEILKGGRAFPEANDALSARRAALTAPPPLDASRDDLPAHVVSAIAQAMSPDLDARYPDCRTLARAVFSEHPALLSRVDRPQLASAFVLQLESLPEPPSTPPQPTIDEGPLGAATTPLPPFPTVAPPSTQTLSPTRNVLAIIVIALLMGAVGAGGVLYAFRPPTQPAAPTAAPNLPEPPPPAVVISANPTDAIVEVEPEPEPPPPVEAPPVPVVEEAPPEVEAPVPVEEPEEEEDAVAVLEPVVAPPPAEEPEPEPEPEQPPVVSVDAVLGVWQGTANGQRFQLEIADGGGGAVQATITFIQGSNQRTVSASGRFDPDSRRLSLRSSEEGLVFDGELSGPELSGSYRRGGRGRSFAWSVTR